MTALEVLAFDFLSFGISPIFPIGLSYVLFTLTFAPRLQTLNTLLFQDWLLLFSFTCIPSSLLNTIQLSTRHPSAHWLLCPCWAVVIVQSRVTLTVLPRILAISVGEHRHAFLLGACWAWGFRAMEWESVLADIPVT